MEDTPCATIHSASLNLAQVMPQAPLASSMWAMAGDLCALLWGRHSLPLSMAIRGQVPHIGFKALEIEQQHRGL